jgi:hypothetical protein
MLPLIIALLNLAPSLVAGLNKNGSGIVAPGSSPQSGTLALNEAAAVIETSAVDYANFEAGNAVVLGKYKEGADDAYVVTFKVGGSAAQALGL